MDLLRRAFRLDEAGTTVRTEILAGVTTFLTMAYIIVVNPAVLSQDFQGRPTGLDAGAVTLATCLAAALATLLMGLLARYPIALAPGMGANVFFVGVVVALGERGVAAPWRVALGVVFVAGVIFLLLSVLRVREWLIEATSPSLQAGIAVGIGIFIAFLGLKHAGLVVAHPGTFVALNPEFTDPRILVFAVGFLVTAAAQVRRVRGAVLLGILAAAAAALLLGEIRLPERLLGWPEVRERAVLRLDVAGALRPVCLPFVAIFLFMDVFDTLGTLVGVSQRAGFFKEGRLPRAGRALLADAVGTVAGAALGTSTVTSYIESAAGVEAGGRTGLTAVVVALLFLLALGVSPVVAVLGSYEPITAAALVFVGAMMLQNVVHVRWDALDESLPAFLILVGIPLTHSIADGLGLGFIAYPAVKLLSGRGREVHPLMYGLSVLMLAYFLWIR